MAPQDDRGVSLAIGCVLVLCGLLSLVLLAQFSVWVFVFIPIILLILGVTLIAYGNRDEEPKD